MYLEAVVVPASTSDLVPEVIVLVLVVSSLRTRNCVNHFLHPRGNLLLWTIAPTQRICIPRSLRICLGPSFYFPNLPKEWKVCLFLLHSLLLHTVTGRRYLGSGVHSKMHVRLDLSLQHTPRPFKDIGRFSTSAV